MKMTNKRVYGIGILISTILIIGTLFHLTTSTFTLAAILAMIAIVLTYLLNTARILKTNHKKVTLIISVFAVLYVALFYTMGIYMGFSKSMYSLNGRTIGKYIIPLVMIIFSTEIIRSRLLIDQSKKNTFITFLIGTLVDISIYIGSYNLDYLNSFLSFIGLIVFSAIANNILYNYLSNNYGAKPVIIYKLITTLYVYIMPIVPNIYPYLRTFLRMLYPLIIYAYIDKYYYDDTTIIRKSEARKRVFSMVGTSVMALLLIALVSCKFWYGILVIGSGSMSRTIEKGDLVFFHKTDHVEKGDVIAFYDKDRKIVHRIIDVKNIKNEMRYYTKGDANQTVDEGYVTDKTLIGKIVFKIKYIGKPTIWLNEKFK